jgi:DNA-binding response OmpR family regulator
MKEAINEKDILLAEDDKDDVVIFKMAMDETNIPYILRHAPNGDVLFVLLKQQLPYILFLDINMPCKDGMACIIEIRKNREYDKLPVIMYTSNLSERTIENTYRNGANLYVSKPDSVNELVAKLKKVFSIDWKNYLHFPPQDQYILS